VSERDRQTGWQDLGEVSRKEALSDLKDRSRLLCIETPDMPDFAYVPRGTCFVVEHKGRRFVVFTFHQFKQCSSSQNLVIPAAFVPSPRLHVLNRVIADEHNDIVVAEIPMDDLPAYPTSFLCNPTSGVDPTVIVSGFPFETAGRHQVDFDNMRITATPCSITFEAMSVDDVAIRLEGDLVLSDEEWGTWTNGFSGSPVVQVLKAHPGKLKIRVLGMASYRSTRPLFLSVVPSWQIARVIEAGFGLTTIDHRRIRPSGGSP
jgi:hypothetical protein